MIFISGPFYYIKEHLKNYAFSEKIDEENSDKVERAIIALSSFNLFGENYILLANVDKWKKSERDKLVSYLNDRALITASSPDMREKFFKYVKKNSKQIFIFEYIKPWETDKWLKYIVTTGKSYGLKIDKGVAFEILKKIGEDYDRIHSEFKKLSSIRKGNITVQDLQFLSDSIIDLTNTITEKILLKEKPYVEINSFYKFKMSSISLLYSLMKNYKTLLLIKTYIKKPILRWNEINMWSKKLKISSGVLAKFVGYSFTKNTKNKDYRKIYSLEELYKILEKLLELEANIKIFDTKSHFISFIEYLNYEL